MRKVFLIAGGVLILANSIFVSLLYFSKEQENEKIAFVSISEVYDGFQYKLELEREYEAIKMKSQKHLDSLENIYNVLILDSLDKKSMLEAKKIQLEYHKKSGEFEQSNNLVAEQFKEQIMKQINQYISDFGNEYGYSLIFGANGTGNIMFAQNGLDITKTVIEYINKKYLGK